VKFITLFGEFDSTEQTGTCFSKPLTRNLCRREKHSDTKTQRVSGFYLSLPFIIIYF
jgi:hypothetical protein